MYFEFWYCAFLLLLYPQPSRNFMNNDKQNDDSLMQYEIYANFMRNLNDQTELIQYNSHKNSAENKDDVQYKLMLWEIIKIMTECNTN